MGVGYIVWSGVRNVYGVMGFRVIIQSSVKDPAYMDDRIEEFLVQLRVRTRHTHTHTHTAHTHIHTYTHHTRTHRTYTSILTYGVMSGHRLSLKRCRRRTGPTT
jgi:secreted Zn-dependent insulinase-like peptidase